MFWAKHSWSAYLHVNAYWRNSCRLHCMFVLTAATAASVGSSWFYCACVNNDCQLGEIFPFIYQFDRYLDYTSLQGMCNAPMSSSLLHPLLRIIPGMCVCTNAHTHHYILIKWLLYLFIDHKSAQCACLHALCHCAVIDLHVHCRNVVIIVPMHTLT